jgi:hypothetical protein
VCVGGEGDCICLPSSYDFLFHVALCSSAGRHRVFVMGVKHFV